MDHPSYHAQQTPDKIAYQMAGSGKTLTYGELDRISNQGAQALRHLGIGPGGSIALLMENRLEFMEICWSAHRAGVFYTAISRYLQPDEISYIVRDCGAKVLIISGKYADQVPALKSALGDVAIYCVDAPPEGCADWQALLAQMPTTPIADQYAGADVLYSSGTTGRPKGITRVFADNPIDYMMPLLNLLAVQMCGIGADSTYLSPAPLYHAAPLRFVMTAAQVGATVIIMEKFDPETFLALIEKHHVTHTQLVPTMFVRMLKLPDAVRLKYDMSSLQAAVHAAAPCPVEIKRQMIDWWGPILIEYYAGSEANGVTLATSQEWLEHPGSVGKSLMGPIRILDEDRQELPQGRIGAVYFDSGISFSYRNDPEKTASAFVREGVSTLGDVGYLDADGYLFLTDRAAYTIISGGVNIYPQETEDMLVCHPAVSDVAVFGVPNEDLGEEVKAVVQLEDPAQAGPEMEADLIAYVRERLSHIKAPRSIDFRQDMPRTETGKLMKRLLKDEYWP